MSCIIVGCKSHSSRKENDAEIISFHRFPSDIDMRQKWINAIARNYWEWKKQHRICSKHFSDDCFIKILLPTSIFDDLLEHSFDNDVLDEHRNLLIKLISKEYLTIRIHYIAKELSSPVEKVRTFLTKTIIFKGQ